MKKSKHLCRPIVIAIAVFSLTVAMSNYGFAQESSENEEAFHPHHQIGFVLSHAHVFEGIDADGKRSVLSLPSWGIDYTYAFHSKWAVGLHTDLIIEKFKVEKDLGDGETIERSYPIAPALMGVYKPGRHWSFLFGMGGEFAKEENFALTRVGVEYGAELPRGWEVFGSFGYDFRWNAYDTWTLGIGVAKSLSK